MMMMKISPTPRGKLLLIGSEDVEVYPPHCMDGHKCVQCYFNGKYLCAPRFWLYPKLEDLQGYPLSPKKEVYKRFGSEARLPSLDKYGEALKDRLVGQPLIPMPDGGYVEELTERLKGISVITRQEPCRITDASCYKCGYPVLKFFELHNKYREQYRCPQCGSRQIKDTQHKPVYAIKLFLKELREQGITREASIALISQRFGHRISRDTYLRYVKAMGLPLRQPGRRSK